MQIASYKATRPGLQALFSIGVRLWRSTAYSHSELVFSDGTCGSVSFLESTRLKSFELDPNKWDFAPVTVSPEFLVAHGFRNIQEYEAHARMWFDLRAGQKYNLLLLLAFVFPFTARWASRFGHVCSTGIGEALCLPEPWRLDPPLLHNTFSNTP